MESVSSPDWASRETLISARRSGTARVSTAGSYGDGVALWRAKKAFRSARHAEAARAFEREYGPRFESWGIELEVEPTRRGLFRESGEGAWLDLGNEGHGLDAVWELAERRGGSWVELIPAEEFGRQLRVTAERLLDELANSKAVKRP
jgi:hypothetical protein